MTDDPEIFDVSRSRDSYSVPPFRETRPQSRTSNTLCGRCVTKHRRSSGKRNRGERRARRPIAIASGRARIITVFQRRRPGAAVPQQFLPRSTQNATPHRHFSPTERGHRVWCAGFVGARRKCRTPVYRPEIRPAISSVR